MEATVPVYAFVCSECGQKFDKHLAFSEANNEVICPNGHKRVRKLISHPAVIFKGSGFYVTDHRSGSPSKEI